MTKSLFHFARACHPQTPVGGPYVPLLNVHLSPHFFASHQHRLLTNLTHYHLASTALFTSVLDLKSVLDISTRSLFPETPLQLSL